MINENKSQVVWDALEHLYPAAACTLDTDGEPFHLFVRGILSAQCTDLRVNEVAKKLFQEYPSITSFANEDEGILAEKIRSCGLHRAKARGIVQSAQKLLAEFDGKIPQDVKTLETFPGVGRKIANLIAGEVYGIPAIVVDTHCGRIARRLGLAQSSTPLGVEKELSKIFPAEQWIGLGHRMVAFGREICTAQNPKCSQCPLYGICIFEGKG